jgi:hypothetical protein
VAVEFGRQNQKVLLADLDLDAGMIGFLTKTKGTYSMLDAVNNLHRLDQSYWKALVSNGIPGVEIVGAPVSLASRQTPKDEQLQQVLAFVRPFYDWTLVDLGRSLSRLSMARWMKSTSLPGHRWRCPPCTRPADRATRSTAVRQNRIKLILSSSQAARHHSGDWKNAGAAHLRLERLSELYESYAGACWRAASASR